MVVKNEGASVKPSPATPIKLAGPDGMVINVVREQQSVATAKRACSTMMDARYATSVAVR